MCDYYSYCGYYQHLLLSTLAFSRPPCIFHVPSEGKLKQMEVLGLFEGGEQGHDFACPAALQSQLHVNTKQLQQGFLLRHFVLLPEIKEKLRNDSVLQSSLRPLYL